MDRSSIPFCSSVCVVSKLRLYGGQINAGKICLRAALAGLEAGINWYWWGYLSLFHRLLPHSAEWVCTSLCSCLFPYKPNYVWDYERESNNKIDLLRKTAMVFYKQKFSLGSNARLTLHSHGTLRWISWLWAYPLVFAGQWSNTALIDISLTYYNTHTNK